MLLPAIYSIYDILGFASPVAIIAELLYGEICLRKFGWNDILPEDIIKQWKAWIKLVGRMSAYTLPRCAIGIKHKGIYLHWFPDASKNAICAAIYVTTTTKDGKGVQNLFVAISRIAPKNQTIPRLELVASLILAKLMAHITGALHRFTINRIVYWVNSMSVLYWLDNKGTWLQYVRNKVKKIQELSKGEWKHVTTYQNPSDARTRGTTKITDMWLKGPQWLQDEPN